MSVSRKENLFAKILEAENIEFEREYKFHPNRKWRLDFAIPNKLIAIEIEGGLYNYGRHNRAEGYIKDIEKYNNLVMLGWRLIRIPTNHIPNKIERYLKMIKMIMKNDDFFINLYKNMGG